MIASGFIHADSQHVFLSQLGDRRTVVPRDKNLFFLATKGNWGRKNLGMSKSPPAKCGINVELARLDMNTSQ
jgi:hypothetical protein